MFKINDTVLYGAEGVCKIADITEMELTGESRLYYVLNPFKDLSSKIYVPVENKSLTGRLSPALSADEIIKLVKELPSEDDIWVDNTSQRKVRYHEIINSGNRARLVQLVKLLARKSAEAKSAGVRFSITDDQYFKITRRMLFEEFSLELELKYDDLVPFINGEFEPRVRA